VRCDRSKLQVYKTKRERGGEGRGEGRGRGEQGREGRDSILTQ
jgi:hypothetical protein